VLLGGVALLLHHGQQVYLVGAARVEAQQGLRLALERLAAEVRGAGFARGPAAFSAIGVAEPTRLTIQHDLNGDGVIRGAGETITYLLRGTTLRRDAGGGAQPVLDHVRHLRFAYLDGDRRPTTSPEAVRSVSITLAVGPATAVGGMAPPWATAATEVRVRNR
jgi:hypothetical protein